jgi:hypothetical protein
MDPTIETAEIRFDWESITFREELEALKARLNLLSIRGRLSPSA